MPLSLRRLGDEIVIGLLVARRRILAAPLRGFSLQRLLPVVVQDRENRPKMTWLWTVTALLLSKLVLRSEGEWRIWTRN